MKISEMPYERPDLDKTLGELDAIRADIERAHTAADVADAFDRFEVAARRIYTQATLCSIRHTVDTRDKFYEAENDFFDASTPRLGEKQMAVYGALLASPFRPQMEQKIGKLAFDKMEIDVKSLAPQVLGDMAAENALVSQYEKLYASAQIEFAGRKNTVSQMAPYKQSADRAVRRAACEAEGTWFDAHRAELDELYDEMVKNRTQQAKKMGYENFVPLGAIRMRRIGYSLADMAAYRAQIERDVVPVVSQLKTLQHRRTGVTDPKFWDDGFCFAEGNPTPHGTPEQIMAAGKQMYHALSPETSEFIDAMFAADAFDVLSKPGKAPGGYCTYLPDYRQPFIFSNFNGTADDVDVLTHEAGHAFEAYVAGRMGYPAILEEPGMESCEIHSMSMEFLTADYHDLFFGADTQRYELSHAEDALYFLPYGTMVDAFQHEMYQNPSLSPEERNRVWAQLEGRFRPWLDFGDLPFYGRGAGWQRQLHIYECPFYYIDYCLAQTVALQFFTAHLADKADAWQRYLALVRRAGSETYPGLVKAARFANPFEAGTMASVANAVGAWIVARNAALTSGK